MTGVTLGMKVASDHLSERAFVSVPTTAPPARYWCASDKLSLNLTKARLVLMNLYLFCFFYTAMKSSKGLSRSTSGQSVCLSSVCPSFHSSSLFCLSSFVFYFVFLWISGFFKCGLLWKWRLPNIDQRYLMIILY